MVREAIWFYGDQTNLNQIVRISKFSKAKETSSNADLNFTAPLGIFVPQTWSFIVFMSLDRFGTLWFALECKIHPLQEGP